MTTEDKTNQEAEHANEQLLKARFFASFRNALRLFNKQQKNGDTRKRTGADSKN